MKLEKIITIYFNDEIKNENVKIFLSGEIEYREYNKNLDINVVNFNIEVFYNNKFIKLDEYNKQSIVEFIINTDFNENEFSFLILNYIEELLEGLKNAKD